MKRFVPFLCLILLALTACDSADISSLTSNEESSEPPVHEHTFSSEWSTDDEYHWHQATCEHTEQVKDKELHDFEIDTEKEVPATFESTGSRTLVCKVCKYSKVVELDQLEHNYATEWSYDEQNNTHYHACLDEGYEDLRKDEGKHDHSAWTVTTAATIKNDGVEQSTCPTCGHKIERVINYTGSTNMLRFNGNYAYVSSANNPTGEVVIPRYNQGHEITHVRVSRGCDNVEILDIPTSVTDLEIKPGAKLRQINVREGNQAYSSINGVLYTKDYSKLLLCPPNYSFTDFAVHEETKIIADSAFSNTKITTITLPSKVEEIGEKAFYNCGSLTSVSLPDSLVTLGEKAFDNCPKITSFRVSNAISYVGEDALPEEFIKDKEYIGNETNQNLILVGINADNLDGTFTVNAGCRIIYPSFNKHTTCRFTKVVLPNTLTQICDSSYVIFNSYVSDIDLPDSLCYLGSSAFYESKITTVHFSNNLTYVSPYAFKDCLSLASIAVDEGNTRYESQNNILYDKLTNSLLLTGNSLTGDITVKEGTKHVYGDAFNNCNSLTSLTYPEGVTDIDTDHYSCHSLEIVNFPKSLEYLSSDGGGYNDGEHHYLFKDCPNLKEINVGENNPYYFSNNGVLLGLDNSFIYSDDSERPLVLKKFPAAKSQTTYPIPAGIQEIGKYAFAEAQINAVIFSNTIMRLRDYSFFRSSLNGLHLEEGITNIDQSSFEECPLNSIVFSDSLKQIGSGAFRNTNLVDVTVPSSVTNIDYGAFAKCHRLERVYLPDGIKALDAVFYGDEQLKDVRLPNDLESFDGFSAGCFEDCESLEYLVVPSSVKSISKYTFENCPLLTILFKGKQSNIAFESGFGEDSYELNPTMIFESDATINKDGYLSYYVSNGNAFVTEIDEGTVDIEIPSKIDGKDVVLAPQAVRKLDTYQNHTIRRFVINDNVTITGRLDLNFGGFRGSDETIINNTLEEIYIGAIHFDINQWNDPLVSVACDNCTALTSASVGADITWWCNHSDNLQEISFMGNRTTISNDCFPDKVETLNLGVNIATIEGIDMWSDLPITDIVIDPSNKTFTFENNVLYNIKTNTMLYVASSFASDTLEVRNGTQILGANACIKRQVIDYVVLPTSLKEIAVFSVYYCLLKAVYYKGTKAQWDGIIYHGFTNGTYSDFEHTTIYYYSMTKPSTTGNYWHYVADVPTIWE